MNQTPKADPALSPTVPQRPIGPATPAPVDQPPGEIGGRTGPEPTRYGDWEVNGRCTDF